MERIGAYTLIDIIGLGGMATVYRAKRDADTTEIALKVIRGEMAAEKGIAARFDREAQTMLALKHPHILTVYEHGTVDAMLYLAEELLPGTGLLGLIRERKIALDQANRLIGQIASALIYAHELGVIHRDLKPHNILLRGNGDAVLTDFGLARLLDEDAAAKTALTQTGAQIGTPAYMPPEQWVGDAADVRSDVYAFGLLIYEILTGEQAFKGENAYDLMHKHLYMPPPTLRKDRPDLPVGVDAVVRRALAKERHERYQTVQELYDAYKLAFLGVTLPHYAEKGADMMTRIVSPSQAKKQEARAIADLEAELARQNPTPSRSTQTINLLPQDVSGRYLGRSREVGDIISLIRERARLISIYGRGGVGKTALACKALTDLMDSSLHPDGVVSLSAISTGISLDRILTGFGKLLGGSDQLLMEFLSRDASTPPAQKANALLEKLEGGRYVLLLDNLETLQTPGSGELTDAGLNAFLETALERGGSLSILITSREPLALPRLLKTWERLIPLDEGLARADAIALLRAFDPDGAAGLQEASEDALGKLVDRAGGFPRALEAIAGLLLEDPLLSVDSLVSDMTLITSEVVPLIVKQAISRLTPEAVRVMEALAVLEFPAPQSAVEYMLAPYMDTTSMRAILARLVRGYFVGFNRATGHFSLHPIDRDYCYNAITVGESGDSRLNPPPYSRVALHGRAAEYYRRLVKPRDQWRNVETISPQINAIYHLTKAGEYDEAHRVLITIDKYHLWEWGQIDTLEKLYTPLVGKVIDPHLSRQMRLRMNMYYYFWEKPAEHERLTRELIAEAHAAGDTQSEAEAYDDLGQALRLVSQLPAGVAAHQKAYELQRQLGNRLGQAESLGGIGSTLAFIDPSNAVQPLEEALAIQREYNNPGNISYLLIELADVYTDLGDLKKAHACASEALEVAEGSSPMNIIRAMGVLSQTYVYMGLYDQAIALAKRAMSDAQKYPPMRGVRDVLIVMAQSYMIQAELTRGNTAEALAIVQQISKDLLYDLRDAAPAHFIRLTSALAFLFEGDLATVQRLMAIYDSISRGVFFSIIGAFYLYIHAFLGNSETVRRQFDIVMANINPAGAQYYMLDVWKALLAAIKMVIGGEVEDALERYGKVIPTMPKGIRAMHESLISRLAERTSHPDLMRVKAEIFGVTVS